MTSVPDQWLRGVAANPAAPSPVLLRLLSADARVCWRELCQNRVVPQEVIEEILRHPEPGVRRYLAGNTLIDPAQRARLVDDADPGVLAVLAGTPRTRWHRPLPDDTIRALLATGDREIREELISSGHPGHVVELAATHPLPVVRGWACGFQGVLPAGVVRSLRADPHPRVRAALAEVVAYDRRQMYPADLPRTVCHGYWHILLNRRLSPELIDQVLDRDEEAEVTCVAGNPTTPPGVVAILLSHASARVRRAVGRRADLTQGQAMALAADRDIAVRTAVSVHPALTDDQRAAINIDVAFGGECLRACVSDPLADLATSLRHASSPHRLIRRLAARDPRLPADTVARLADDDDLGVRVLLAHEHPNAPAGLLLRCFLEYTGPGRWELPTRPNFPTAGLARFAADADPLLRQLATRDPLLTPEWVNRLADDREPLVRQAAATHPHLPPGRLYRLLRDADLARWAAANPALPVSTMLRLLEARAVGRNARGGRPETRAHEESLGKI
jgi:Leucine rich repeat variant